jgi:hypothetical protein
MDVARLLARRCASPPPPTPPLHPPPFLAPQLIRRRRFLLYDYGSAAANRRQYGQDEPLDVAAHYHLLQVGWRRGRIERLTCPCVVGGRWRPWAAAVPS